MPKLDDSKIAERLEEVIRDHRMKSSRSFALKINADPSFFAKVLKGKRPIPESMIADIGLQFKVNRKWLLEGIGPKYGEQNVPRELFEVGLRNEPNSQFETLLIQLMNTQNQILNQQKEDLVDRLKRVETNLNDGLARLDSIKLDQLADRDVVLRSLARIEKKKNEHALLDEARNIVIGLLEERLQQGSTAGKRKSSMVTK